MSRPKTTAARPAAHDAPAHDSQAHDDLRRKYAEIHRRLNLMAAISADEDPTPCEVRHRRPLYVGTF